MTYGPTLFSVSSSSCQEGNAIFTRHTNTPAKLATNYDFFIVVTRPTYYVYCFKLWRRPGFNESRWLI